METTLYLTKTNHWDIVMNTPDLTYLSLHRPFDQIIPAIICHLFFLRARQYQFRNIVCKWETSSLSGTPKSPFKTQIWSIFIGAVCNRLSICRTCLIFYDIFSRFSAHFRFFPLQNLNIFSKCRLPESVT